MSKEPRPLAFWVFTVFMALSVPLLLAGQTISVFYYDLTVRLGLQESVSQVSQFGVEVNRAFGAGDTLVYIPLLIASLVGLWFKKEWALVTTSAVAGVSAYWSSTIIFMFLFLPGTSGYNYTPGLDIWLFVGAYLLFGVWGFFYLLLRGRALVQNAYKGQR